ncbi:hypothetical protein L1887_24043 [Cichorium endivia]|nr:hypothetical protein L1887_24043 [Cichorium endivia]
MALILYIDLSRAMNYVLTVEDEEATPEIDCPVVGDDIDILTVEDVLYLVLELDERNYGEVLMMVPKVFNMVSGSDADEDLWRKSSDVS